MAKDISNEVAYYYDSHPTEEDLMGETAWHSELVAYLKAVLTWLFHDQTCAIYENLNFYRTLDAMEYPIAPDLAIIKGVSLEYVRSWAPGRIDIPPHVVFEVLSKETWKKDLREKPAIYADMGVRELFAYDPQEPPLHRETVGRLFGWRLDTRSGRMVEMTPGKEGWLWSEQLDSWLVPEGIHLRLYDREGQIRLTGEEAQTLLAEVAIERAAEADERAVEADERAARLAEQLEQARQAQAEAIKRAEEEARRAQALAETLRSLGIDPDTL
jgi:Uma2 family endonuclease